MADSDLVVTSLAVTGGFGVITAQWSYSASLVLPLPYLQLDHFEVWAASVNNRASATLVAEPRDLKYPLTGLGYGVTRYFWIRAIDRCNQAGDFYPLSATGGLSTATKTLLDETDILPNSLSGAVFQANVITARELVLTDFSNMLPDAGFTDTSLLAASVFETGMSWDFVAGTGYNAKRLRFVSSGTSTDANADQLMGRLSTAITSVPVIPGESYAFGFRGARGASSTGFVRMSLYWYDSTITLISNNHLAWDVSTGGSANLSNIAVAPSTAAFVQIRYTRMPAVAGGTVNNANIYIENAYVRKAYGATLIVDGGIVAGKLDVGAINTSSLMVNNVVVDAKILAAAVTDPISDSASGTFACGNTYTTRCNINVVAGDYPITVGAFIDFTTTSGHVNDTWFFTLYTTVGGQNIQIADEWNTGNVSATGIRFKKFLTGLIPPLPAGTYPVLLRSRTNGNNTGDTSTINTMILAAGSVKK